jgi:hypothetical protein
MKLLFIYFVLSATVSIAVVAFGLVLSFKRKGRPENDVRKKILYLVSYNPDTTPGINKRVRHLLPKELALLRCNSIMQQVTFKNVIRYKIYKFKVSVYEKLSAKTKTENNAGNLQKPGLSKTA